MRSISLEDLSKKAPLLVEEFPNIYSESKRDILEPFSNLEMTGSQEGITNRLKKALPIEFEGIKQEIINLDEDVTKEGENAPTMGEKAHRLFQIMARIYGLFEKPIENPEFMLLADLNREVANGWTDAIEYNFDFNLFSGESIFERLSELSLDVQEPLEEPPRVLDDSNLPCPDASAFSKEHADEANVELVNAFKNYKEARKENESEFDGFFAALISKMSCSYFGGHRSRTAKLAAATLAKKLAKATDSDSRKAILEGAKKMNMNTYNAFFQGGLGKLVKGSAIEEALKEHKISPAA